MAGARQWHSKHVPVATNTHSTTEELYDVVFSMQPVISNIQYVVKEKWVISSSRNF
jgi:hypothetical protein